METKPVRCLSVNMLISAVKLDILMLVSKSIWEYMWTRVLLEPLVDIR